jgi:two-component system nitrogen regulation sensor histidine kinase NtrY
MKLRTRIILAMTTLMVTSLIVIGAVTIFYFQVQNDNYHQERLARKERAIKTEMAYFSKEVEIQQGTDVVLKEFEQEVLRLSEVHNMEMNIYNTDGEMLVSAHPGEIHSEYMDRRVPSTALEQLKETDRVVIPEQRDRHSYLSDYTLLKNATGQSIAILNLPYRQDLSVNQNDLPEFLGSIGLTYLFLFIAAIGITILLSNSITRNLSVLSEKLKTVDLNSHNEAIPWNNKDEIGQLISAYNEMLSKLEESRKLLAKTEREGAWREMARQVAHEIKNPLTPIKLSVQHLQATSNFVDEAWQSKFNSTMEIIIQQIESLNKIASEFSDFAKMHEGGHEQVNVSQAIYDVITLFSDSAVEFNYHPNTPDMYINIDPDAFRRVLNNLIKNAKQALEGQNNPLISIRAFRSGQNILVEVEDNGPGIPAELESKIFQPNFTTKSSGTGLGLAICQQIIEGAAGTISICTTNKQGATFQISLPSTS